MGKEAGLSEPRTKPGRSRRELLAGAAGGLAAFVAGSIGRVPPARADNGQPVLLGQQNSATAPTAVTTTGGNAIVGATSDRTGVAVMGESMDLNANGPGVLGVSDSGLGPGVLGIASNFTGRPGGVGVHGDAYYGRGVAGTSHADYGVVGDSHAVSGVSGHSFIGNGVEGWSEGPGAGVLGRHAGGTGVLGQSGSGIGVLAQSDGGAALSVQGISLFSRSGSVVVPTGQSSAKVTGVSLTGNSPVLATIQQNAPFVFVRAAVTDPNSSSFTVYLGFQTTNPSNVPITVGWFLVN